MKKTFFLVPVCAIMLLALDTPGHIDKTTMERGKKVYTQYCSGCHQIDGSGVPGLNPPIQKNTTCAGN